MNNKEKYFLVKASLNQNQKDLSKSFKTRPRGDSRYSESVAADNRRSELSAAKHREQSEALKKKKQAPRTRPSAPPQSATVAQPRKAPSPWHAGYVNPDTAKIQQGEAEGQRLLSEFNKQPRPRGSGLGVTLPKRQNNQLARKVGN